MHDPGKWSPDDAFRVDSSPLERVICVGEGRSSDGIVVELSALELRSLGAIGFLRIEFPPRIASAFDVLAPVMTAADDLGMEYTVTVVGSDASSAGPGAWLVSRERFAFVPPVSPRASNISIVVLRIGGQRAAELSTPEGTSLHLSDPVWLDGPWAFSIPLLRSRSAT